jgi:predicted component of type VI protein secretion system
MIAKLIVASGKSAGRSIAIKRNRLLIGRAEECDVRPLSEEVSRRHCAVVVGPADVWVEDLGSRNGTFVNGDRIAAKTRLTDGDLLRVGSLELKLSCSHPEAKAGSEDDVSRWLMADEKPAGMFDTTRTMPQTHDDADVTVSGVSNIHAAASAGPAESPAESPAEASASDTSFVSGIETAPAGAASRPSRTQELETLKAANSKPGQLPQAAKKSVDSSRDAAAEALKKFFEKK